MKIGALLSVENHAWFNKQSPEAQAEMNRKFQEYKKCQVVVVENLDTDILIGAMEIEIEPKRKKEKYDRARENREFRKRVDEDLEDWER